MIMQPEHLLIYTDVQQRDLNLVRLYLQVSKLSDMVDPSKPNRIELCLLDAVRHPNFVIDKNWPRQEKPTASQRRLWKRFMASSYLRYIPYWTCPPVSSPSSIKPNASGLSTETSRSVYGIIKNLPRSTFRWPRTNFHRRNYFQVLPVQSETSRCVRWRTAQQHCDSRMGDKHGQGYSISRFRTGRWTNGVSHIH
jgi:hypothetical protein